MTPGSSLPKICWACYVMSMAGAVGKSTTEPRGTRMGEQKGQPGRALSNDDITHYHKVVLALSETIRRMAEVDKVIEEHGHWPGAARPAH